jgi:hypothetical protein
MATRVPPGTCNGTTVRAAADTHTHYTHSTVLTRKNTCTFQKIPNLITVLYHHWVTSI